MSAPLDYLECAWLGNPFNSDAARENSNYCAPLRGELVHLLEASPVSPFSQVAHSSFRAFVQASDFPCLGGRAAIAQKSYRFGAYASLDDPRVSEGLTRDLYAFALERRGFETAFTTFIAVFRGPRFEGERDFEGALWSQLQRVHELDAAFHPWDGRVSSDPHDDGFSFSVAGNAFFVVGLHPKASRPARRFAWPALVFNAHEQFEQLRVDGRFEGLQRQIRRRDLSLSGALNPMVADYGAVSEARQYSGRNVEGDWQCPFRPKAS